MAVTTLPVPGVTPIPSLTALVSVFHNQYSTLNQIFHAFTGIFTLNFAPATHEQIMGHFLNKYIEMLGEVQRYPNNKVYLALAGFNTDSLFGIVARHAVGFWAGGAVTEHYCFAGSMYNWMIKCAILPEADPERTLKRAIGNRVELPYIVPFNRGFKEAPPFTPHESLLPEVKAAFRLLSQLPSPPSQMEIFYVLGEFVRITLNVADTLLTPPNAAYTDEARNRIIYFSAKAVYERTAARLTNPNSQYSHVVKHVLARSFLARICFRWSRTLYQIDHSRARRAVVERQPQAVRLGMYRFLIQTVTHPTFDTDGRIRAVVNERFDPNWKFSNPTIWFPRDYRPCGFEYEMGGLDRVYKHMMSFPMPNLTLNEPRNPTAVPGAMENVVRPQTEVSCHPTLNDANLFAGEYDIDDGIIAATGPLIDPLRVANWVIVNEHGEQNQCKICLDGFHNQHRDPCLQLRCKHRFHKSCLGNHINTARQNLVVTCPICRAEICPSRGYRFV